MELKDIKAVYFIGAGGIGMSAIARYFLHRGVVVAGYDKTPSALTEQLEKEGMLIHFDENPDEIPHACRNSSSTLVVYTPAVPADHKELARASAWPERTARPPRRPCAPTSCTRAASTATPSSAA